MKVVERERKKDESSRKENKRRTKRSKEETIAEGKRMRWDNEQMKRTVDDCLPLDTTDPAMKRTNVIFTVSKQGLVLN
jgi:hypothetical protein